MQQPPHGYGPPPSHGHQQQGYGPPPGYPPQGYAAPPVGVWTCPFCRATTAPRHVSKVSTGGWVVFVLLLIFCLPICWIGLLMKDSGLQCSSCFTRIGG